MRTVFILLHFFGTHITHLKNLKNCFIVHAGIMLDAFANLLYLKLCQHKWRKPQHTRESEMWAVI